MKDFKFAKILPIAVRDESLAKDEGEEILKMPDWACYCCHDSGWINPHLAALIIEGYNFNKDRNPVCQNCEMGFQWLHLKGNIDLRISKEQCIKLDEFERLNWQETLKNQFERLKKNKGIDEKDIFNTISKLAESKSLRKRKRTVEEESNAQYKHDLARTDRYELAESKLLFNTNSYKVEDSVKADSAWDNESAFPIEKNTSVNC